MNNSVLLAAASAVAALGGLTAALLLIYRPHLRLAALHLDVQTLLAHLVDADEAVSWGDEDAAWELASVMAQRPCRSTMSSGTSIPADGDDYTRDNLTKQAGA